MAVPSHTLVAELPGAGDVVVKPIGRCTAPLCCTIKEFLQPLQAPAWRDIWFDLSETDYVDSTSVGYLLMLTRSGTDHPSLHLVNPTPAVVQALRAMRVEKFFDVCPAGPDAAGEWRPLNGAARVDDLGNLVVEAHKSIIGADDRNIPAFQPVVDRFSSAKSREH